MTNQMEALLMIAQQPALAGILNPIVDTERESMDWDRLSYGVLSGGQKAGVSWAYCIWTDGPVPAGWRDPFEGFGVMSRSLQIAVLKALALRHGVFEKMGEMETYLRRLSPAVKNQSLS